MRFMRRTLLMLMAVVALLGGVQSSASAWERPGKAQANKIWRAIGLEVRCSTGQSLPRRGIRIADARPRGFTWAAVNYTVSKCGNGVVLVKARLGTNRWRSAGSFGSDFTPDLSGSCSNVRGMPARIIPDLTGMTCKGRTTPRRLHPDPWF